MEERRRNWAGSELLRRDASQHGCRAQNQGHVNTTIGRSSCGWNRSAKRLNMSPRPSCNSSVAVCALHLECIAITIASIANTRHFTGICNAVSVSPGVKMKEPAYFVERDDTMLLCPYPALFPRARTGRREMCGEAAFPQRNEQNIEEFRD